MTRSRLWMRQAERVLREERGQDLAEYALLISLITLALIASITLIGGRLSAMFAAVAGVL